MYLPLKIYIHMTLFLNKLFTRSIRDADWCGSVVEVGPVDFENVKNEEGQGVQ